MNGIDELITPYADEATSAVRRWGPPANPSTKHAKRSVTNRINVTLHDQSEIDDAAKCEVIFAQMPKLGGLLGLRGLRFFIVLRADISMPGVHDYCAGNTSYANQVPPVPTSCSLLEMAFANSLDDSKFFVNANDQNTKQFWDASNREVYNEAINIENELVARRKKCTTECRDTTGLCPVENGQDAPSLAGKATCKCGALYQPSCDPALMHDYYEVLGTRYSEAFLLELFDVDTQLSPTEACKDDNAGVLLDPTYSAWMTEKDYQRNMTSQPPGDGWAAKLVATRTMTGPINVPLSMTTVEFPFTRLATIGRGRTNINACGRPIQL